MKTDSQIQKDVMDELKWEPFLNAEQIGVAVKNGVVTLSGKVDMYSKKTCAEKAAKKVAGVKAVAEDIEVILPGSSRRTDSDIAEAALHALKWHSALQEDKIKLKVESGIITLEGEVDWEFQRDSARLMVENLTGVWSVINKIKITPRTSPKELKKRITSAFQRNACLDSENIDVEISDHKAVLTGHVRSWAEKEDAEKAAWAAPGITSVENELEINSERILF